MAISKRLRFEIFRRDGFACRYCGARNSPLEPDHVVPRTLGGADTPENLATSCEDCNAGKGTTLLNGPTVSDIRLPPDLGPLAAAVARELLAEINEWDRGMLLDGARAELGDVGEGDLYVATLKAAFHQAVRDRDLLQSGVCALLERVVPRNVFLEVAEIASKRLFEEYGYEHTGEQSTAMEAEMVARRLDTMLLDGLPVDEAAAWREYAKLTLRPDGPLHDLDPANDVDFLAANCARAATESGRSHSLRGMCALKGDGPGGVCMHPETFRYALKDCRFHADHETLCSELDECAGHGCCELHLGKIVEGDYSWNPPTDDVREPMAAVDFWPAGTERGR